MAVAEKTLIAYQGPVDMEVLSFFGKMIKKILVDKEQALITRIYKIYIELVQNISYYSADIKTINGNDVGSGAFEIMENGEVYKISTKNMVRKNDGYRLLNNCAEINNLNTSELRMLKRIKRRELIKVDTGAHIGLIHVGLLAENKLNYKIEELNNDYSVFNISINVKKNAI
ncbi:MAG: hypothetical protein GVY19_04615 [Bacteroidetes bacterium]|jgi:hypothetical protein|nr:hypothetical protein [Bacteroidota bacterium]